MRVLKLLLFALLAFLGWKFFDWAFLNAVWRPDPQACRAASGACWGFIVEKHRLIAFGTYPYEEHWRPALSSILLVALWVLSAIRPRLIVTWAIAYSFEQTLLLGNKAGLEYFSACACWGGRLELQQDRSSGVRVKLVYSLIGLGDDARNPFAPGGAGPGYGSLDAF